MPGSAQILINVTDLDSGNDGNGTGTDETAAPGRVVDIPEKSTVGVTMFLSEADAAAATTTETLDVIVQISPDGGTTWGPLITFRTITASEIVTGSDLDESAGDPTFRRAAVGYVGEADSGQDGLVQMRLNTVASHASNQFALFADVRDVASIRDRWLENALVA